MTMYLSSRSLNPHDYVTALYTQNSWRMGIVYDARVIMLCVGGRGIGGSLNTYINDHIKPGPK